MHRAAPSSTTTLRTLEAMVKAPDPATPAPTETRIGNDMKKLIVEKFQTTDGRIFTDAREAQEHQVGVLVESLRPEGAPRLTALEMIRVMCTYPEAFVKTLSDFIEPVPVADGAEAPAHPVDDSDEVIAGVLGEAPVVDEEPEKVVFKPRKKAVKK
jgi:hypothetical protein